MTPTPPARPENAPAVRLRGVSKTFVRGKKNVTALQETERSENDKFDVLFLLDEFAADHPEILLTRLRPALTFQAAAASAGAALATAASMSAFLPEAAVM